LLRNVNEYLDLYVLALAALTFTIFGFLGDLNQGRLSSAILALLTVLAIAQIRSRNHVARIAKKQSGDPLVRFLTSFPERFFSEGTGASSFLYIGKSMARTVQTMKMDIMRILRNGGQVRVLILDPTDDALLAIADSSRTDLLRGRVRNTLDELETARKHTSGRLEIRVASFIPNVCIRAYSFGQKNAVIFVQHYAYKPPREAAPIFQFDAKDGFWHEHFAAEANRMWEDAIPWPLQ
jgi:hypothetical protein